METTITVRGQTAVPAALRRRYNLKPHTRLEWIDTPAGISVIPVPKEPLKEFRGAFKGTGLTQALMRERAKERERERREDKK